MGGCSDGLQRWRWGGEMQQFALESILAGCVFLCVCVGGGGTLSKPMGVYIMFYGYEGTHKSLFH